MRTCYEVYARSEYGNSLLRGYRRTDDGKFEAKRFADTLSKLTPKLFIWAIPCQYEVFDPVQNRVIYVGGENVFGEFLNAHSPTRYAAETD